MGTTRVAGGVREDDIILEVNGIETAGKDRCLNVKFAREQDINAPTCSRHHQLVLMIYTYTI